MQEMNIGYIRKRNNIDIDKQIDYLKKFNIDKIYYEESDLSIRDELNSMVRFLREGDVVYTYSLLEFGTYKTSEILDICSKITEKGAVFRTVKEQVDTSTASGELILNVYAGVYQFVKEIGIENDV